MLPSCSAVDRTKAAWVSSHCFVSLCQAAAPANWAHDKPDTTQAAALGSDSGPTCSYTRLATAGVSETHHRIKMHPGSCICPKGIIPHCRLAISLPPSQLIPQMAMTDSAAAAASVGRPMPILPTPSLTPENDTAQPEHCDCRPPHPYSSSTCTKDRPGSAAAPPDAPKMP